MPRNTQGQYTLPVSNPVVSGTLIESDGWANPTMADLGAEVENSLDRDGRGAMRAALGIVDGAEATPGLRFNSEVESGLNRSADGVWSLTVKGKNLISLIENGSVGAIAGMVQLVEGLIHAHVATGIGGIVIESDDGPTTLGYTPGDAGPNQSWTLGTLPTGNFALFRIDDDYVSNAVRVQRWDGAAPYATYFSGPVNIDPSSGGARINLVSVDGATLVDFFPGQGAVDQRRFQVLCNVGTWGVFAENDAGVPIANRLVINHTTGAVSVYGQLSIVPVAGDATFLTESVDAFAGMNILPGDTAVDTRAFSLFGGSSRFRVFAIDDDFVSNGTLVLDILHGGTFETFLQTLRVGAPTYVPALGELSVANGVFSGDTNVLFPAEGLNPTASPNFNTSASPNIVLTNAGVITPTAVARQGIYNVTITNAAATLTLTNFTTVRGTDPGAQANRTARVIVSATAGSIWVWDA